MSDMASAQAGGGSNGAPLVLVIDDNPDALSICERTLRSGGYRTAIAASGETGLARVASLRPSLVVLDLAMPGTDGFAVARAIRACPGSAAVPILVCTGMPRETESGARAAGGTEFCLKPVEPRRLLEAVRRLCPLAANGEGGR